MFKKVDNIYLPGGEDKAAVPAVWLSAAADRVSSSPVCRVGKFPSKNLSIVFIEVK